MTRLFRFTWGRRSPRAWHRSCADHLLERLRPLPGHRPHTPR